MHGRIACRIVAIHPLGTIDIEEIDGDRAWRVSGLTFSGCNVVSC